MVNTENQIDYALYSQKWRTSMQSANTRSGNDYESDHELFIVKFGLKLKKISQGSKLH